MENFVSETKIKLVTAHDIKEPMKALTFGESLIFEGSAIPPEVLDRYLRQYREQIRPRVFDVYRDGEDIHVRRVWDCHQDKWGLIFLEFDEPRYIMGARGDDISRVRSVAATHRARTGRVIKCKVKDDHVVAMLVSVDPLPDPRNGKMESLKPITSAEFADLVDRKVGGNSRYPQDFPTIGTEHFIPIDDVTSEQYMRVFYSRLGKSRGQRFSIKRLHSGYMAIRKA